MWLIDFILNLAGLLLWLKWRQAKSPQMEFPGISLAGTLKRASSPSPKLFLFAIILGLLIVRSVLYWQLGSALGWTPRISLGVISLPFRSDHFGRIFTYSFLSLAVTIGAYYLTLLFFSIVNARTMEGDVIQRLINDQLGWISELPTVLKWLIPIVVMLLFWLGFSFLVEAMGLMPPVKSFLHRVEQGIVIGLGVFIGWKFVVVGLMLLYLLNSYVYFGTSPVWTFVDVTGRRLLALVRWIPLRLGRIDFGPIVLCAIVILIAAFLHGFEVSLHSYSWKVNGLVYLYQRLPL